MKTNIQNLALLVLLSAFAAGCAAIKPGNDPVVVRAEQATKSAIAIIDSFVKYEYDNRLLLQTVEPKVKLAADKMRVNAPQAFASARNLTKAYKLNRTAENKANLNTIIMVLDQMAQEATALISKFAN
jgi:hypothetical protein